jgi:hypothetical protein
MADTLISIGSLTFGGDDITLTQVQSFSFGSADGGVPALQTVIVGRAVDDLSAAIVVLFQTSEPRPVTLTFTDDSGGVRLQLQLTDARVTSYVANGGASVPPMEQFTLEAASVEMTTGSSFAVIS